MGVPEAVGAAIASGKNCNLSLGDRYNDNLQELQTIVHYNLPVKVVVFTNDGYNATTDLQKFL